MENKINISQLICTRISHDLIGNVGAFANAVELMEDEDDEFLAEIKSTLKTSSQVLTARLKFFRMAFGLSNANLENIETVKKLPKNISPLSICITRSLPKSKLSTVRLTVP